FWLAGSYGSAERLREALELGAAGVQVGTAFAYCEESGLADDIKKRVLAMSRAGTISVFTDPNASPTGFPFKVLELEGTQSDWELADARSRTCDLGYLRQAFERPDGSLGWRCAGEPVKAYLKKGGTEEDTTGKKCVCNGLLANVGLGQVRHGEHELPLITSGNDVATISRFPAKGANSYSARDVIDQLVN
ncbi:MAG: nitronate monooxygenase, partial [Planctomycetota bacterium]